MCAFENENPSVLITGASTGIGAACAFGLDKLGYRVFAGVRREADGDRLREQAAERLAPVLLDGTGEESFSAAAEFVKEAVGDSGLNGLVNNAGLVVAGPLEVLPIERLRYQFEVNVIGQVAVTQAFLPMLRVTKGRIVNMGSISGRVASPYLGAYAASKHALEALTDSLRIELRKWGIQISIVQPGPIVTPIWDKTQAAAKELSEAVSEEVSAQAKALYGGDLEALREVTNRLRDGGSPVEIVVRAVVHALTARRPKTRYPVPFYTRFCIFALKRVTDRVRDFLVRRELKLP